MTNVSVAWKSEAKAPLAWTFTPNDKGYYINTVAIDQSGSRMVTGTFHHNYSKSRRRSSSDKKELLGTYCLDPLGNVIWKHEVECFEGVYWAAITPCAKYAASCGRYTESPSRGFVYIFDAATGDLKVNYTEATTRVSICAFSKNSQVLAAAGPEIYIFNQKSAGEFYAEPHTIGLPPTSSEDSDDSDAVQGLALDSTGKYVAVGTYMGNILLVKNDPSGSAEIVAQFNCGESVHSVAMNDDGTAFIAGSGGGKVHYFNIEQFISNNQPVWEMILSDGTSTAQAVYGVAMDGQGQRASAVGNIGDGGVVGLIDVASNSWIWTSPTEHNPNSTSMTTDGGSLTVADGHPDGNPGSFYLFSAGNAEPLWVQGTGNMSWPMQISADGRSAIGGSDDGSVYYFSPLRLGEK